MPELVVIHKPLHFGGKERPVGERFTASDVDAKFLMKRALAEPAPERRPLRRADVPAPAPLEPSPLEPAPAAAQSVAGRYNRRDLRPQD